MKFEITFYVEGIHAGTGTLCYLPRIGESMRINSYLYIIKDIVHHINNGTSQNISVSIYLKIRREP